MSRCVVDTNVPIVANGRVNQGHAPAIECREAAVKLLLRLVTRGTVLLDSSGAIQEEYRTYLNPRGQPGVGDRFYQVVLHSAPNLVQRFDLPTRADGEYVDMPQSLIDAGFDPSDRKFASMAKQQGVPVFNAVDSDWIQHAAALNAEGIVVSNLCGVNPALWFTD